MIELHTWGTPNGRKVSIMLEECGLPYSVHKVDISKGEQFKPEFLREAAGDRLERGFRSANEGVVGNGSRGTEARKTDNSPAVAHEGNRLLRQQVERKGVGFQAAPPVFEREFERGPEDADGGVADDAVSAAGGEPRENVRRTHPRRSVQNRSSAFMSRRYGTTMRMDSEP